MKEKVKIGDRSVGRGEPTFVVAEIGSNHDQKLNQAKQLIEAAAESKGDAVKFQVYSAKDLYPSGGDSYEAVRTTELPIEWIPELAAYSKKCGLLFFASPFSEKAVDCLSQINTPAYKIASSEAVNLPLLKYTASKQKPLLISTGICNLADIDEAIEVIRSEGNEDMILLQCTSLYPTPTDQVHLRVIQTLQAAFNLPVGFSDHTLNTFISVAAVTLGACVIEKHLTISRLLKGPDHSYALEPVEFRNMVQSIRMTEEALGSPIKRMLPQEMKLARRESLRAARGIAMGEILKQEMLVSMRPGDGIASRFLKAVLGEKVRSPLVKGEALTWAHIEFERKS